MMSALGISMVPRISLSLVDVATGLQSGKTEIFDLTADSVCKNAWRMLQRRWPRLGKVITTLVPIAILGYGAYLFVWKPLHISNVCDTLYSRVFAEIVVKGADPLNDRVTSWMASQKTATSARGLTLQQSLGRSDDPASKLKYISSAQISWYQYKSKQGKKWLRFERKPVPANTEATRDPYSFKLRQPQPDVAIRCFSLSGDSGVVQSFLESFKTLEKQASTTRIFRVSKTPESTSRYDSGAEKKFQWDRGVLRPSRELKTVAMEVETKQYLVTQVEKYLSKHNKTWHAQRGLPLRKGILLHGPPGTGKTSFCTALAGHFDLNLYILSFTSSTLDDETLQHLFEKLPARSVVLLEDVDVAGLQRDNIKGSRSEVTLSGLLNVIDGAGAVEGRLLIMTSNSANSLDPALVRPGRCDHHVLMGNAVPEVAAALFKQVYTDIDGKPVHGIISSGQTIEQLASAFGSKMPTNALSPAEVQGFLLGNRDDPMEALARFDVWTEKVVAIKSSGRNVEESPTVTSNLVDREPERRDSCAENAT